MVTSVVDFGLARFRDVEHNDGTITQADAVAGTPAYMSPEQCRSLKVSYSTDLYAFGCILTEMLQLTPPFAGETVIDTISKHMFAPVPPLTRPEGCERVPVALERLRRELLAKLPTQRPADARTARDRFVAALLNDDTKNGVPERKSVQFTGTREERTPDWNRTTGTLPEADVPEGARIGHLLVGTANVAVNSNTAVVVTRTVRPSLPEVRIIVCMHGLTTALMNQLIEAGADDVARGPVTSEGLGRKVNRLLRRRTEP